MLHRFEVNAAWVMGVALPLLETLRRRTDFSNIPAYADDFVAGGLLLWAAASVRRGRPDGRARMVAAWGILTGGGYYSFFGQVADLSAVDVSGLPGEWVAVIKAFMFVISLMSLILSVRAVGTGRATEASS